MQATTVEAAKLTQGQVNTQKADAQVMKAVKAKANHKSTRTVIFPILFVSYIRRYLFFLRRLYLTLYPSRGGIPDCHARKEKQIIKVLEPLISTLKTPLVPSIELRIKRVNQKALLKLNLLPMYMAHISYIHLTKFYLFY